MYSQKNHLVVRDHDYNVVLFCFYVAYVMGMTVYAITSPFHRKAS